MILLRPGALLSDVQQAMLPPQVAAVAAGRILRLDCQLQQQPASLICVYAPADPVARRSYFDSTLPACLPAPGSRLLLLGGDWNCVLHQQDVVRPALHGGTLGSAS
jgi:hypothetical protein